MRTHFWEASLDVVCVREEMGGGGSRTLLSVLEFVTIPRGEVSKFENCVAKYPLLGLCSHPCLQRAKKKGPEASGLWFYFRPCCRLPIRSAEGGTFLFVLLLLGIFGVQHKSSLAGSKPEADALTSLLVLHLRR